MYICIHNSYIDLNNVNTNMTGYLFEMAQNTDVRGLFCSCCAMFSRNNL